jgi:hypothetical protein
MVDEVGVPYEGAWPWFQAHPTQSTKEQAWRQPLSESHEPSSSSMEASPSEVTIVKHVSGLTFCDGQAM